MNRHGRRAGRHRKSAPCLEVLERRELLAADLVAHWLAQDLLAQQAEGAPIVRWVDRVHGVATATEGQPFLVGAAVGDRAAIRFDPSDGLDLLRVTEQNNPLRTQTDFAVVVVFATSSADLRGDQGPWFENTGLVDASELGFTRDWGVSLNHTGQLSAGLGFGLQKPPVSLYVNSNGLNDGQTHVAVFSREGTRLSLQVDDLPAVVSEAGHHEPLADVDLVFGALQHRQGFFPGDIAEVRLYRGAVSAAELDVLRSELQAFYHNSPPTAVDDQYVLQEDPLIFAISARAGVLHNDQDLDGDALTAVLVDPPRHGQLRLSGNGSFVYDPDLDFFGTDRFTYAAVDFRRSPPATVQLTVTPSYDPVFPRADGYAALPREVLRVDASQGVLANDENPDRVPLQVVLDQDVGRGQLTLQADGSLTYDAQGFVGTTSFTYRVQDGTRLSPPTLVTLSVNTPPVAVPDRFVGREDQPLTVSASAGVLANDIDPDGQPRSVQLVEAARHGEFVLAEDGSFEYRPVANFVGTDHFTYRWTDGVERSAEVTVVLEIEAVNDPPVASVDHYFTLPDLTLNVPATSGVLVNDVDVDGPELKSMLIESPAHGVLNLSADGAFSFRPARGFRGTDFFTYRASDSLDVSPTTRVNLTITETPLQISEFMATNASLRPTRTRVTPTVGFAGPTLTPDWIELENLTDQPLDVSGMSLTDDPQSPQKWRFPSGTVLPSRGYLLVFASGRNVTDPALDENGWLHTNFSLSGEGEYLALTARDGTVLHEYASSYPRQVVDVSYGLIDGRAQYFRPATPGRRNVPGLAGLVAEPSFSHPHGFYQDPFEVELSSDTLGATLVYTTDGSEPTLTNGVQVVASPASGPAARLEIGQTTTLRAAAFKEGWVATDTSTQSYLFLADILQDSRFSSTVKNHPVWGPQLADSLLALPTVSLVFPGRISETERETSLELIFPDGTQGFQVDAGIEYFGGHSLGSPKKNMRLSFKSRYGDSQLKYDLFGAGATDEFEQLLLRTGSHDTFFWTHPDGGKGNYIRNRWAFDRQLEMGQPAPHGRFVHVYLNGEYWGQHELMERPNAAFMASYFGGFPEDYDALNAGTPVDGDAAAWQQLQRREVIQNYERLQQYLDVANYADYMLLQFFGGNDWDWNHTQNWMAARRRESGAGFAFFSWDSDVILRTPATANVISRGGPGNLWNLSGGPKQHDEFKMLLADRAQRYFFHDGMFTDERLRQDIDDLADQIRLSMIAETARWGSRSYTPDVWESAITWMRDRFAPAGRSGRAATVVRQLRQAGLFPNFDAPEPQINGIAQYGGDVALGDRLTLTATSGVVYYTLNGVDPRLPGGALHPDAQLFSGDPLVLNATTSVKTRVLRDGQWSALAEVLFDVTGVPASAENLRISEVHYHPGAPTAQEQQAGFDDADEFEFIELVNISNSVVELAGVRLAQVSIADEVQGVDFQFDTATVRELAPGQCVLVVEDVSAFETRYGSALPVAGAWSGRLGNGGETITLLTGEQLLQQFAYDDGWHPQTDGQGKSLEIIAPQAENLGLWQQASGWRPSGRDGGSPGMVQQAALLGDANRDGLFDSRDLLLVFAAHEYEDLLPGNSTWEEGDWNGDGDFTSADMILSFQGGGYAAAANGKRGQD